MNNERAVADALLYAVIGILVCLLVLFGGYFVYKEYIEDKGTNKEVTETTKDSKDTKDTTETKTETTTETNTQTEVKDFDLSKFDYTKVIDGYGNGYKYEIDSKDYTKELGLSASLKDSKKEVALTIDWSKYSKYVEGSTRTGIETYSITNFTSKIKDAVTMGFGQASGDEYAFYLMEDGTVEYTPIGNTFKLNNESNITLKSLGKVPTVAGVVKIAQASGYGTCEDCADAGYTVLGIKADGTFYDLGKLLSN